MAAKSFGKSIVLILIILILIVGGLLWFDRLGVVNVKSLFSPVYKVLHKEAQTSQTASQSKPLVANLDEDRLKKQREANDIYKEELDKREADIAALEAQNAQIAAELKTSDSVRETIEILKKKINPT